MNRFCSRINTVFLVALVLISCNSTESKKPTSLTIDSPKPVESVNPYIAKDQSPMDMCYYPKDYPILKMNGTDTAQLLTRIIYSRPQKKGRAIFGTTSKSLCEYGKEWRLGANEATEIEFFKDVNIAGKKVNKGRYVLYGIPYPDKWTIILNTNLYTWGLHLDRSKDIFQTDIKTEIQTPSLEDFTMIFEDAGDGANLIMAWDDVRAVLPIKMYQ